MSSSIITLILILTGAYWSNWWPKMESAVIAIGGMWIFNIGGDSTIHQVDQSQYEDAWHHSLTPLPAILHQYQGVHMASDLIKQLKDVYDTQGLPQIFADFKAMMDTLIPANGHPGPAFMYFKTLFTKLSQAQYTIPGNIQAMIVLSCLSATIYIVVQLLVQIKDTLENVITTTLDQIITATTLNWEQCAHMGATSSSKGKSGKSTNKISAVKCKETEPSFQKQQNPTVPSGQQQDSAKGENKSHGKQDGKKQKEKRRKSTSILLSWKTSNLRVPPHTLCTSPLFHPWLTLKLLCISQHNSIKGLSVHLHSLKHKKHLILPIAWTLNHPQNRYIPLMLLCCFFSGSNFLLHSCLFPPPLLPLLSPLLSLYHLSLTLRPFQKTMNPLSIIAPSQ